MQAELEALDPIGYAGVNVTSAGLSAQYEKMWRISFVGSPVEGNVESIQVSHLPVFAVPGIPTENNPRCARPDLIHR